MRSDLPPLNGISLDRLQNFCNVAEKGGIAKAVGDDLSRQALVSRQIRELESYFGTELTRRKGKGIEITEAGKELARIIKISMTSLGDFKAGVSGQTLEMRIAAGNSVLEWWLMPRLKLLEQKTGLFRWHFYDLRSGDIIRGLVDHTLDFGIVRKSAVVAPLVSKPILEFGYALFCPKAWGNRTPASLLKDSALAVTMGGEFYNQLRLQAARHKIDLRSTYHCTSFTQAAQLVRAGGAAAILPELAEESLSSVSTTHRLPWLNNNRNHLHLVWHQRLVNTRPQSETLRESLLALKNASESTPRVEVSAQ